MSKQNPKENIALIDGVTYKFKFNGNICCGVFLLSEYKSNVGEFYCNGDSICCASDASHIERLYSALEINKSLIVTDENGNTIDFDWCEGVIELSGVVNNEI